MKKILLTLSVIFTIIFGGMTLLSSCAVSQTVADKSGATLWGENCNRCHNAPSMGEFTNAQWDVISQHMRVRANLTADETTKIISYLHGVGL